MHLLVAVGSTSTEETVAAKTTRQDKVAEAIALPATASTALIKKKRICGRGEKLII